MAENLQLSEFMNLMTSELAHQGLNKGSRNLHHNSKTIPVRPQRLWQLLMLRLLDFVPLDAVEVAALQHPHLAPLCPWGRTVGLKPHACKL